MTETSYPHGAFADALQDPAFPAACETRHAIMLNRPDTVWFILRGYADLFTSWLGDGETAGARTYFFTAGRGELLFGLPECDENPGRSFVAVPSLDAEILRFDLPSLLVLAQDPAVGLELSRLLERWIGHLSSGISREFSPRTDLLLEPGCCLSVPADRKVRACREVVWLKINKGNALFLGMKEVNEPGEDVLFPVTRDSWIQTVSPCEMLQVPVGEAMQQEDFWTAVARFHKVILFCDLFNIRLATVDEYNRLSEKAATRMHKRRGALVKIASVINDSLRRSYVEPGQDPMLVACKWVGAAAGIRMVAPNPLAGGEQPALTLNDLLHASRLRTRTVRLAGCWWSADNGPLLAFTSDGNAPVALVPRSPGRYWYVAPSDPIQRPLTEQLAHTLKPEAQMFYRPLPDHPVTGKDLLRFGMLPCARELWMVLLIGLAGGGLTLLLPVLTGLVFDQVIPREERRQLLVYGGVIFSGALALAFTEVIRRFIMIRIETKLDFALQAAIWDRLLSLPVPFFRNYQAGELASRANSIMALRKVLSETVIYTVIGSLFLVFNLALLFFFDYRMATLATLVLSLATAVIIRVGNGMRNHQAAIILSQQKIFGMLFQFLSSISKIRIGGAEVHAFSEWAVKFAHNKAQTYTVRRMFLKISTLATLIPATITLLVFAMIARQLPDTLSTGQFLAFYTALTVTVTAFLQLGMAGVSWFMAAPMLESIHPILEATPENITLRPEIGKLAGEIEVVNLSFRYQPDGPRVLDNVSLHVRPGEYVAIVGVSGSGKSTLLRLLLGFEAPETGSVLYDRQDIASVDPSSLRRQAGTVLQQSQLSAGSILTNITGMTNATLDDAWAAARAVGLDDDIRQMPMGMHTVITGGISTLSGGQRQRILIARAIVNKPRILFFDEATSALDNRTQQIVSNSLETIQATRIVIAHRLTTVRNADRICLMENGRIAEAGTYDELMARDARFTELVKRQMIE